MVSDRSLMIKCRFNAICTDDVTIGLCYKSFIEKKKYQTGEELANIGHGCYMLSCNGSNKIAIIILIKEFSHILISPSIQKRKDLYIDKMKYLQLQLTLRITIYYFRMYFR